MKSNIQQLRELLSGYEEVLGLITQIEQDYGDEIDAMQDEISVAKEKASYAEDRLAKIEQKSSGFKAVDLGIGTIEYKCDNIELQARLEEFLNELNLKYIGVETLFT